MSADTPPGATPPLRERLQAALMPALRSRDDIAVSALRSTLAALAEAEAVPVAEADPNVALSEHVAGSVAAGGAEVPRAELDEDEVRRVVATEAAEREEAASHYEAGGFGHRAERLRAEAVVIRTFLD